jgi:hypothetical protein
MRSILAAVLICVATAAAAQQNLPPTAFYGVFSGGGVAESEDSAYFGVTARDLDVVIRADGPGFSVAWTTVIRQGGDPNKPNVRRKVTIKTFQPVGGRPNLFRAVDSGDPLAGPELVWARIRGSTLTIYLMSIESDGSYEMQRYDRTVSGDGMQLLFTREKDGDPVRKVTGRMVKQGN